MADDASPRHRPMAWPQVSSLLSFGPRCVKRVFQGPLLVDQPVGPHSKTARRHPSDHPFQGGPIRYPNLSLSTLSYEFRFYLQNSSQVHPLLPTSASIIINQAAIFSSLTWAMHWPSKQALTLIRPIHPVPWLNHAAISHCS